MAQSTLKPDKPDNAAQQSTLLRGSNHDREILRALASRVRDIAELPEMNARRNRWRKHNALHGERPLILCYPEGAWSELLPQSTLQCEDEHLRRWEWTLRSKIYWWEHIRDDNAIEPHFNLNWHFSPGDYGVEIPHHAVEGRGSYVWEPPLQDIERDLEKLQFRQPSVDREATLRNMDLADDIFGDILPPRIRGSFWWTSGLTHEAIKLVGIENMMVTMLDEPSALHALMGWLRNEHENYISWFEREGLLSDMNEDDYVGSGGVAYTNDLPLPGRADHQPARLCDLWGFAESQETVGVSPGMFEEFVLPYQMPILERFGLNCYGCCEPVHSRIQGVLRVPRLRRVSVSPWADQEKMAESLGRTIIYSRKPNPALVCMSWDEDAIRADLDSTLQIAGNGPLEIILKDTHTVQNESWRITQWVQIALDCVARYMDGKA